MVQPPALTGINFENSFGPIILASSQPSRPLRVVGTFADGVVRDITRFNTVYASSAPAVLDVNANGVVSARGVGSAVIVASNSNLTTTTTVRVFSVKGDGNRDGTVTELDVPLFSAAFTGPIQVAGFIPPTSGTRDTFDFDNDGDIDCDDFVRFASLFGVPPSPIPACNPCMPDLNHDGILDPDDLADYITGYFSQPPSVESDFNGDGTVDPDDLADYVTDFFAGC